MPRARISLVIILTVFCTLLILVGNKASPTVVALYKPDLEDASDEVSVWIFADNE